ncbi:Ribosomal biogenesis protein las1l [Chytridiales sp. JEL 0842]|nr:Ribosomal biogenesis protein las1l [Chytridiales sp. JEL 0842]
MVYPRLPRLVPWSTPTEWDQVYTHLFSPLPHLKQQGVKRVKAWANRGKVPHAVDSTAAFVEVWLRDGLGGLVHSHVSEHEIRLMYTMVFIRFVNGIVEPAQKGVYAQSVLGIAESLGLPSWFVDLRHTGTHDRLPSISILRSGCLQALDWLHANYWAVQKSYVQDTTSYIKSLLSVYKDTKKKGGEERDLSSVLGDVTVLMFADNYRDFLIPALLEPGFLVPTSKKKRSKYPDLTLPDDLLNTWTPALIYFEKAWGGFIEDLFLFCVNLLADPTDDGAGNEEERRQGGVSYLATVDFLKINPEYKGFLEPFITYIERMSTSRIQMKNQQKPTKKGSTKATIEISIPQLKQQLENLQTRPQALLPPTLTHHAPLSTDPNKLLDSDFQPNPSTNGWAPTPAGHANWERVPIGCLPGVGLPSLDLPPELDDLGVGVDWGVVLIERHHSSSGGPRVEKEVVEVEGYLSETDFEEYGHQREKRVLELEDEELEAFAKRVRLI